MVTRRDLAWLRAELEAARGEGAALGADHAQWAALVARLDAAQKAGDALQDTTRDADLDALLEVQDAISALRREIVDLEPR